MAKTAHWLHQEFTVHQLTDDWRAVPGLYVFAGLVKDSQGTLLWRALYVGRTQDFSTRIPTHEKWSAAKRLGATHVHARVEPNSYLRVQLEADLIEYYQPPLNEIGR